MAQSAKIAAVSGYVPEDILTNQDLERMVDTTDEWITTRTGIRERHILKTPGWASSDMGAQAVKTLLSKSRTDADEIDLIICATVTPDTVFPDTANTIATKCGLSKAFGFDVNAACSGFLYSLVTGVQYIRSGMYRKVIVVGVDTMSSIIDYEDRATCIIFGDGAGAVLLEPCDEGQGYRHAVLHADGTGREYLHMKAGGSAKPASIETVRNKEHYVYQEGKSVFKRAVSEMATSIKELLDEQKMTVSDIDWLVPHQANMRILQTVASSIGIDMDRVMVNIHKYGNTTAATLPLCLNDYESQLSPGDHLVLTAFGGGFTWGACSFIWG